MVTPDVDSVAVGAATPTDDVGDDIGLAVRPSTIPDAGRGLFATRPFPRDAVVCVYTGDVLRTVEAVRLTDKAYLMRLGEQVYVNATECDHSGVLARYMNDCCNDALYNVTFRKLPTRRCAEVVALRDIAPGEELNYDYGLVLEARHTPKVKAEYACRCGSTACRGTMLAPKKRGR